VRGSKILSAQSKLSQLIYNWWPEMDSPFYIIFKMKPWKDLLIRYLPVKHSNINRIHQAKSEAVL